MNVLSETLLNENCYYVVTSQLIYKANELVGFHSTKAFIKKCFWKDKRLTFGENIKNIRDTVHNFSSYQPLSKEEEALSFGLDEHIPSVCNRNKFFTEFEMFYQNILKDISHLNNDVITRLKTNFDTHVANIAESKFLTNIVIVWIKITFFKRRVSIILWSFSR